MKKLFFALLLFFTCWQVDAQLTINGRLYNVLGNYNQHRGLTVDSNFNLPTVAPKFGFRPGALRYNVADSSVEVRTNFQWLKIGTGVGGGGSTDTTSLSNRINNSFNQINLLPDSTGLVFLRPNGLSDTLLFSNSDDPDGGVGGNVFNEIEILPDSSGLVFSKANGTQDTILFEIDGSSTPANSIFTSTSVNLTLNASHAIVNLTSSGLTITLPSAIGNAGKGYTIKLSVAGTGSLLASSGQSIDGASSYPFTSQYKYVTVVSNGANWIITSNN